MRTADDIATAGREQLVHDGAAGAGVAQDPDAIWPLRVQPIGAMS